MQQKTSYLLLQCMELTNDHSFLLGSKTSTVDNLSLPLYPPNAYNFPLNTATPNRDLNIDIAGADFHDRLFGSMHSTVLKESPCLLRPPTTNMCPMMLSHKRGFVLKL